MSGARIHPPSPFKLRELRRRGLVPRSALLTFASVFLAVGLVIQVLVPGVVGWLRRSLTAAARAPVSPEADALLTRAASVLAEQGASFVAVWLVAVLVAVAVSIAQVGIAGARPAAFQSGPLDTGEVRARWSNLVSSTLRSTGALTAAVSVTALATIPAINDARRTLGDPFALTQVLGALCLGLGGVFLVLGLIDVAYVRYSYFQSHRMTQAERDEELRNLRGQGQTIRRSL